MSDSFSNFRVSGDRKSTACGSENALRHCGCWPDGPLAGPVARNCKQTVLHCVRVAWSSCRDLEADTRFRTAQTQGSPIRIHLGAQREVSLLWVVLFRWLPSSGAVSNVRRFYSKLGLRAGRVWRKLHCTAYRLFVRATKWTMLRREQCVVLMGCRFLSACVWLAVVDCSHEPASAWRIRGVPASRLWIWCSFPLWSVLSVWSLRF